MQMKKLTHPRIANLKDQTNNTLLQDGKDPHDKGQYYMFYLDNAQRAIDLMIQKHKQAQSDHFTHIFSETDLKIGS